MPDFTLPPCQPTASSCLPLTLMSLEEWALITIQGPDSTHYLQGQMTLDVTALATEQHQLSAHCDAKGKMWSILRLFHHGDGYAGIERRSVRESQLNELKKYAVFSKVTIAPEDNVVLLGLAGFQARAALAKHFAVLPDTDTPVIRQDTTSLMWFNQPAERFLLIVAEQQAHALKQALSGKARFNDSQQWLALDIEAGLPVIDAATSALFIPQATNLQALKGISFKKGCYTGQETVARAKFRGANKRAMYWLAGQANHLPLPGEALELQMGENWRRTGTVLAAVQLDEGDVWLQAVLNNDLATDSLLRVAGDEDSQLMIQPLPYSLTE